MYIMLPNKKEIINLDKITSVNVYNKGLNFDGSSRVEYGSDERAMDVLNLIYENLWNERICYKLPV